MAGQRYHGCAHTMINVYHSASTQIKATNHGIKIMHSTVGIFDLVVMYIMAVISYTTVGICVNHQGLQ